MTTTVVAPELAFVLAAVRVDAKAGEAQRDAATRVRDWDAVVQLARRHDVAWWVSRALPAAAHESARQALADDVRALAHRALAGAREMLTVAAALESAGVRALAYKGPALAVDVHGDIAVRRFTDLDLLIAEHDLPRAREALGAVGYHAPEGMTAREASFYGAWEGVAQLVHDAAEWPLELHWRCQAPRYGAPQDPASLMATPRRLAVGGATVLVPGREELAALLALHGVKHAWGSLLWIADFAHAVQREGFEWARLTRIVDDWKQRRALHDAVLVAHEVLAVDVPAALLARARDDARASRLARAVVAALRGDVSEDVGRESTPRYDLQWVGGAWARARYLTLAVALPTPQERRAIHLPDALLPLAYPLRAARLVGRALGWRS